MLAGPRKKQKISADPRNKQWIEDPNQFGRRLMEKMGWSDGKGLGTNENGDTEFVKVSLKGNTKGLGFNRNEEENWMCHQDDFNDLLSQLHQEHSSPGEAASQAPKSIEEKSKKSRKRVHYKKFTRGKDLANRSVDDMNCILGRRSGSSTPQNVSAPTSDNESDNHGVPTITNAVSVQDYFAQKMQKLKESKGMQCNQAKDKEPNRDSTNQGKEQENDDDDGELLKRKKNKKNKKKRKRKETGDGETLKRDEDLKDVDRIEEQGDTNGEEKLEVLSTGGEERYNDAGSQIFVEDKSQLEKMKKKRKKKKKQKEIE